MMKWLSLKEKYHIKGQSRIHQSGTAIRERDLVSNASTNIFPSLVSQPYGRCYKIRILL